MEAAAMERATTMKAMVHDKFGPPDVVKLREVEMPELVDDGVLVRVRASSLNKVDWYGVSGMPWVARPITGLRGPKSSMIGSDFAGTVEAVGREVTDLESGDDVFGAGGTGSFAEYVCAQKSVGRKPANLTFEEAAAVPVAALTALQGLRDHGHLQAGQKVLVNGASGGVGTFAVQIAKALGAEVTAVCSTRNVEQARSLGAGDVIDYTREDFTRSGGRYDVILDVAGTKSWSQYRRVMNPDATLVMIGAPPGNRLLGPLGHVIRVRLAAWQGRQKAVFFIAKHNRPDMEVLRELLESGKVKPVVEKRYELGEVADALRYMGEGHAQGKLVINV
jgi:NADPH:quinone reductase-like Zn-dependent oxidoreductase